MVRRIGFWELTVFRIWVKKLFWLELHYLLFREFQLSYFMLSHSNNVLNCWSNQWVFGQAVLDEVSESWVVDQSVISFSGGHNLGYRLPECWTSCWCVMEKQRWIPLLSQRWIINQGHESDHLINQRPCRAHDQIITIKWQRASLMT